MARDSSRARYAARAGQNAASDSIAAWPYWPADRRGREALRRVAILGEQGSERAGTRNLIADLLELHRERLNALFDQTLDVIEDAMKARKFLVVNRVLVDVGPDHFAQLEAVKMFTVLMCHASKRTL